MITSVPKYQRPPSKVGSKQVPVGTSRIPISSASLRVRSVTVKADDNNTGKVFVGGPDVTASNGYALYPGQAVDLFIDDLSSVYLVADSEGQLVYVIYVRD